MSRCAGRRRGVRRRAPGTGCRSGPPGSRSRPPSCPGPEAAGSAIRAEPARSPGSAGPAPDAYSPSAGAARHADAPAQPGQQRLRPAPDARSGRISRASAPGVRGVQRQDGRGPVPGQRQRRTHRRERPRARRRRPRRAGRPSAAVPAPASTRTDVPARKSAWSSCERSQDAPWPIASMPIATARTSSRTGPAPRIGRRLNCQPASAAGSPRPPAARRSASRATGGSSRSVSTVPASRASAGAATSSGSMPSVRRYRSGGGDGAGGLPAQLPVRDGGDHQQPDVRTARTGAGSAPGPAAARWRTARGQRGHASPRARSPAPPRPPPPTPRRPSTEVSRRSPIRDSDPCPASSRVNGPASSGAHTRGGHREQQRLQRGEPGDPPPRSAPRPQQPCLARAFDTQQPGHEQQRVAGEQRELEGDDQQGGAGDQQRPLDAVEFVRQRCRDGRGAVQRGGLEQRTRARRAPRPAGRRSARSSASRSRRTPASRSARRSPSPVRRSPSPSSTAGSASSGPYVVKSSLLTPRPRRSSNCQ